MPEDGYNHWKICKYFSLDSSVPNYSDKKTSVERITGKSVVPEEPRKLDLNNRGTAKRKRTKKTQKSRIEKAINYNNLNKVEKCLFERLHNGDEKAIKPLTKQVPSELYDLYLNYYDPAIKKELKNKCGEYLDTIGCSNTTQTRNYLRVAIAASLFSSDKYKAGKIRKTDFEKLFVMTICGVLYNNYLGESGVKESAHEPTK